MKTDSLFYRLFQKQPALIFELAGFRHHHAHLDGELRFQALDAQFDIPAFPELAQCLDDLLTIGHRRRIHGQDDVA